VGQDEPQLFGNVFEDVRARITSILDGNLLGPPGEGAVGPLFVFLPQPLRDHLPDSYRKALA
jgi:hypothetical protein